MCIRDIWEDDPSEIELEPKEPLETIDAQELADYIIAVQQRTKRPRTKHLPDFIKAVSYTHLDVYKRQIRMRTRSGNRSLQTRW